MVLGNYIPFDSSNFVFTISAFNNIILINKEYLINSKILLMY